MLKRVKAKIGIQSSEPEKHAKQGGHGDHWGCVVRGSEEGALLGFINEIIKNAAAPEMFRAPKGYGMAVRSAGERLRGCVLVEDDKLVSAYPEAEGGTVWPVTISEIVPWANGIEGQITGVCYGANVSFFDTRFCANQLEYKLGETYNFHINAFAYTVSLAPDIEVETDMGAKVSLKGAHAYMPANLSNESADIDDYWFHSALEGESATVELAGKKLNIYPVIIAIPDEFEMHVSLYAAPHVLAPGMETAVPDDDLEGFLWLQGYLAQEQE